jgi:hypothetical protein
MRKYFRWVSLTSLASLASLISLLVIVLTDKGKTLIALCVVIVLLLAFFTKLYLVLDNYVSTKYPDGHIGISNLVYYSTEDGNRYVYEVFKHIQCKKPVLTEYTYGFKWTGTTPPTRVTSQFQLIDAVVPKPAGEFDEIRMRFKKPLLYNEVGLVHVVMDLDDHDRESSPHLVTRVTEPMQLLRWHVQLRHLPATYHKPAEVLRKRIDAQTSQQYEHLTTVQFAAASRSYEHHIPHPDVGYFYRLVWEKG